MKSDAAHLWALAQEISTVIERWLLDNEGKTFYARLKKTDMLRLTRLQVWSWRHRVSVYEILSLTLPYLRKSISTRQKAGFGLGVTIASLTGLGNEKILIEAIKQQYPDGEHIDVWRQRERDKQLAAERGDDIAVRPQRIQSLLEADSVADFLKSYRVRTDRVRNAVRLQESNPLRRRKPYANNPWI